MVLLATVVTECGDSACRQPATVRVVAISRSGRRWSVASCAAHRTRSVEVVDRLGFTLEAEEQIESDEQTCGEP